MYDYSGRIQIVYAAVLSLLLLFVFLPIAIGWKIIATLIILVIAGGLLWRLYQYRRRLISATANIQFLSQKLDLLPARQRYRLPILLVTGNAAKHFFPADLSLVESNIVVSSDAIWIYVAENAELPIVFDSLVARWPDMLGRIGLFLAINPTKEDKQGLFIAKLHAFRQSWVDTCRLAKYRLPVYLSTHVSLNDIQYNDKAPLPVYWYQLVNHQLYLLDEYATPLKNWVNSNKIESGEREQRMHLQVMLTEIVSWFEETVLPTLTDSKQPITKCVPTGAVIFPLNDQQVSDNIIDTRLAAITSLVLPNQLTIEETITPPDRLVKHMPLAYPFSPLTKMVFGLIMISCFFVMGCLLSSYWNNLKLIDKVQGDIHSYRLIAGESYAEKLQALTALKQDKQQLNDYFQRGIPIRLGFGLYRGQQLIEPINQAISEYVPAPPKIATMRMPEIVVREVPVQEIVYKTPDVIRLDSMSMFDSGRAVLKADSNKLLINALLEIKTQMKANPDASWLILIAGYTDNVGDATKNLQLSLQRAAAVRDWFIHNGDLPETCFATQGYGAKKPLVSNDTPVDRAKNRRVEISLLPQQSACKFGSK